MVMTIVTLSNFSGIWALIIVIIIIITPFILDIFV